MNKFISDTFTTITQAMGVKCAEMRQSVEKPVDKEQIIREQRENLPTKSAKEKIKLKDVSMNYAPDNIDSVDLNYLAMCMIESHMKKVSGNNAIEEIPMKDGSTLYRGQSSIIPGENFTLD